MIKIFKKKNISNIVFVIVLAFMLYPPTREWGMRQIAFSPSVEDSDNVEKIDSYNWELQGLNTEGVDFRKLKDKVIFVNFWATWCPPCRAEMPMIQELYNDYKNDVAFIFVTNENWKTVNKFFEKNNYDLPTYNSIGLPPKKLSETNSIPASYLINKQGEILISKVGAANWNSDKVRKLLDDLLTE